MTGDAAPHDLLVVDAAVERHALYRALVGDLVGHVETAASDDEAARLVRARPFAAVLVRLDSGADEEPAIARVLTGHAETPVIFVVDDMRALEGLAGRMPGLFDALLSPIVPEVLCAKIRVFLDQARTRERVAALEREVIRLAAAVDEERQAADVLRQRVGAHIHRGNNLLAIMQSIARRTLADGRAVSELRDALIGRLQALARAYALASAAAERGVDLADMVEAELGFASGRVTVAGPPVRLAGSFPQTFALVLHELATNAARYGALCVSEGSVNLGWTYFEHGPDRYLEVGWTERGGPPPPDTAPPFGFGLTLVSSLAGSGPDGPHLSFTPEGFACRMRLPHEVLVEDAV